MKIKVLFGLVDSKEVFWYKDIDDFPKLIKFLGRNYEWVFYGQDPTGQVDMVFTFVELPSYDPNYGIDCRSWSELFGEEGNNGCECGAKFTSFSWDHMRMCRKWGKW
jgi:hypothetical protein